MLTRGFCGEPIFHDKESEEGVLKTAIKLKRRERGASDAKMLLPIRLLSLFCLLTGDIGILDRCDFGQM
jgi:hypothetical protein